MDPVNDINVIDRSKLPPPDLMFYGIPSAITEHETKYCKWSSEKNKWYHFWLDGMNEDNINFFDKENIRNNGVFALYKAREQNQSQRPSDVFEGLKVRCDNHFKRWHDVHPDWVEGFRNPLFEIGGYGAPYGAEYTNEKYNLVMQKRKIVYDGSPYFFISHCNFVDINKPIVHQESTNNYIKELEIYEVSDEFELAFIKQRPFHAARTLGELLKLIMDWDICYDTFNSRENMAILSHNVMMSIDMPKDIYEEIYQSMPDTVLRKFLLSSESVFDYGERPQTPESVINWLKEKYWDLRWTKTDIPNVKFQNEFYYRRRSLI